MTTPSISVATMDASAPTATGGVSTMTTSARCRRLPSASRHAANPSKEEGLGCSCPAGITRRLFSTVSSTQASKRASPIR